MSNVKRASICRIALCAAVLGALCAGGGGASELDLGCLYFRGEDIEEHSLVRAAGPVFEFRTDRTNRTLRALRPFHSVLREEAQQRTLHEVLWPVGMLKYYEDECYWRLLLAYGHDFDTTAADSRYRVIVLPVWFNGRDADGREYAALFPVGGRIHEFLGRDVLAFVLFPLYGYGRVNNVETHSVLWPIFSRTTGPTIDKLRVFPLYGYAHKQEDFYKRFVLWPFWTSVQYLEPEHRGGGFVLFPLYGHLKVGEETESWMVLPPFFRFSRDEEHRECYAPWPFFQYASGDYEKLYLWPLWGRKELAPVDSWFFLWPIVSGERVERDAYTIHRFLFLPFVQHEARFARDEAAETGDVARPPPEERPQYRYLKLWPLLNYQRQEDKAALRLLALWPFKNARSIDRNYRPFWTLYSHVADGSTREDELLWGLIRWRRDEGGNRSWTVFPLFSEEKSCKDATSYEWNFLLGLAGYKREGPRKTYRLLYFIKWQRGPDDAEP